jgi:hypothetical protein
LVNCLVTGGKTAGTLCAVSHVLAASIYAFRSATISVDSLISHRYFFLRFAATLHPGQAEHDPGAGLARRADPVPQAALAILPFRIVVSRYHEQSKSSPSFEIALDSVARFRKPRIVNPLRRHLHAVYRSISQTLAYYERSRRVSPNPASLGRCITIFEGETIR